MEKVIRLLIIIFLFSNNAFAGQLFNAKKLCEREKGVWREFGNSCADNCSLDRGHDRLCISKLSYNCDCLENKCWDYYQCVDNFIYQIEAENLETQRIKILKEQNPELFIRRQYVPKNIDGSQTDGAANSESGSQNTQGSQDKVLAVEEQIASCASLNGIWKKFPNGCADTCSSKAGPAVCASVITESCECGADKCWNGSTCLLTENY